MLLRSYDPERDREAIRRVWYEVGWAERDRVDWLDELLQAGNTLVAEVGGQAESYAHRVGGVMRYLEGDLPFCLISAVATSHVARKRGAPKRLVARSLAEAVREGALVAGLGMFDQGFYNQLGFGTGPYEKWIKFDPATLTVPDSFRVPRRLTAADWEAVHASRMARRRVHGGCSVTDPAYTRGAVEHYRNGIGLGYCDGPKGELTHHLWISAEGMSSGPYHVQWMAFRDRAEFLELMALLRSLGDQIKLVTFQEPPGIQMQDLLARPFRQEELTSKSRFESGVHARAWWQMRIIDLPGCLARTHLPCADLRFNLRLADPVAAVRDEELRWRGIGGEYLVTLGEASRAEPGFDPARPTLDTTVNAFTRVWLGVGRATGLAYTDHLEAPEELLTALDAAFAIPEPRPDWDF